MLRPACAAIVRDMGEASKPGLSDEKAARMMTALGQGRTLRPFGVKAPRLEAYFKTHPEYAQEALPLIAANTEAARLRKGDSLRTTTHCRAGLHLMTGDNVFIDGTHGRKRCLACRRASTALPPRSMKVEEVNASTMALQNGASIGQICFGKPVGGGKVDRKLILVSHKVLKYYRRENPDFDQFVRDAISDSNSLGQKIRHDRERSRAQNEAKREEKNDYHKILAMFPANFPGRHDAAQDVFVALYDGSLKREDMRARVKLFMLAENRMFPTKYAKFAGRPLLSLDEQLFDDGSTTRGDTISRGLWD